MRISRRFFVLFGLALALQNVGAADDAPSRSLVEKAIEAHGGEKLLTKFKGATSKLKGTIQINGAAVEFTGELASQEAVQQRINISFVLDGQSISFVSVRNRDQGWLKINNDTIEMSAEQLAEAKEQAYSGWVATLVPLKDPAFTLAPFGEIEIAGRKAAGVNVAREGHRPINLFFDKETSRLLRTESRVKDDTTGQEVTEEATYSEYKMIEGTQQPTKLVIKRDGKPHAEVEVTEFKPFEKLDDSTFARP